VELYLEKKYHIIILGNIAQTTQTNGDDEDENGYQNSKGNEKKEQFSSEIKKKDALE
jgi:hypothetical protein